MRRDRVSPYLMLSQFSTTWLHKSVFFRRSRACDRGSKPRLINHHFLGCWRDIDPTASKNRGLLSLMRRHRRNLKPVQKAKLQAYLDALPALQIIYRFKQHVCYLLLKKHRTRKPCVPLVARLLDSVNRSEAHTSELQS